jgi:hypothetical protein
VITHPFHPLCGQRFPILKARKIAGQEVFSLEDEKSGSLSIPRDWTDQAVLSSGAGFLEPAPLLNVACLLKLDELIRTNLKAAKGQAESRPNSPVQDPPL